MSQGSKRRNKGGKRTKIFAGRYAYIKPLGRGAGGSVYLAEDLQRDFREVALKVLSAEACETVQGKMLRREFEILSKLDHPNLVRVYDYGKLPDGGVFLAEEYIDGFSLQDARALLEPQALIDPTLQILQGLAYLHAMGMIHRDIKPANVMLLWLDDASARPMVKLVDFGLSSMDPKRDTLRGGTRSYMAPEIIRGNKGEKRSDLYSLGVTLYYALCGVLPFGPRSKEDPPPTEEDFRPPDPHRLNDDVPLELSRFTMALLRQLPDVDYADAGEALQALAADAGTIEERSVGQMANSLDVAAAPLIRGFFERGILSRRIEEDDLLLEWLSIHDDPSMGQIYLIRGDEGAGKSRLLHDVQASAKLSGQLVLSHQCTEEEGPYSLMVAMVERLIKVARSHDVDAVEKYMPALYVRKLLTKLGVVTPGENVRPFVEQAWMRTAIEDALAMLHPHQVVFFIDDIDAADEQSLEILFEWFGPAKSRHRPNIVATTGRGQCYSRFSRQKAVQVLPIEGVGTADVEAFFREQLGIEKLSQSWLESVALAADGRPAYIEELCRYLIDAGMLWRQSVSNWTARVEDIEAKGVPGTLRESLRRRITAVGAAGRECLELLALMERPLSWESARRLLESGGSSSQEAERTLQTVQWRHLVNMELTAGGRFVRVVHQQLAEAVADMLSPEWRRALHRRIGEQVASDWQRGKGEALEAATHLYKGGKIEEASPYFEIAGDAARQQGEHGQARTYYRQSLNGAQSIQGQALLNLKLAAVELALFEPKSCRKHLSEAARLADDAQNSWLLYRVHVDAGNAEYSLGDMEAAHRWVQNLKTSLAGLADKIDVSVLLATLYINEGELDEAAHTLDRCLQGAQKPVLPGRIVELLCTRAHIDALCGDQQTALKRYRRAQEVSESIDDPVLHGALTVEYGADLRRMGSPVEAKESLLEALPLLAGSRAPNLFTEALFQLAWTLIDLGNSAMARHRANEAFRLARLLGHRVYEQKVTVLLASLVLTGTDTQPGGLQNLQEVVAAFDRSEGFVIDRAEVLMALGDLMITLQLTEQGPKHLQRGRQMAFESGARGLLPPVDD